MSIASFIRDMLPTFGRRDVREKIRSIGKKLSDVCRPSFAAFAETMNTGEFVSAYGKLFRKNFLDFVMQNMRTVKFDGNDAFSGLLTNAIENAERLLDKIETYVGTNMQDQIHVEGMTYQKAAVLRLLDLLDFFADYSSRNLAMIVAAETNMQAFDRADKNPYSPHELNYLLANRGAYFQMVLLLNADVKKAFAAIESIPEIIMSEADVGEVPALAGGAADPLRLGSIPVVSGIFEWIGIRKVDWDISRFERAKKERKDIELRLESLRQKRSGNMDAQNEQFIENYERELTLARAEVADYERKLAQ